MILSSHGIIGSQILQATGLLIEYPGAAAAYSLRLLRSTYTGSAIRVRRASDNTEQDIGFVSGELDTSSLLSFVGTGGTDNGFVKTWYDQSGNGYDATQTTAASQPKIVSSGSVILEGTKPSLQFDGSNNFLETSVAYPTQEYQNTYYVASSTGTNNRVFDTRGTGASVKGWHSKFSNPSGDIFILDHGVASFLGTTNITRSGQKLVSVLAYGGSGSYINEYTNGSLQQNNNDAVTRDFDSGTIMVIGASRNDPKTQFFGGTLQEGILYNINTSTNRTGIEDNINTYYSIY